MLFGLEREFPVLATGQDPTKIQDLKSHESQKPFASVSTSSGGSWAVFDIQILLSNVKNVWLCSIQATQTLGPLGEALRAEAAEADLAMSLPKLSINFNGFQLFQRIWPGGLCIELLKGSLSIAVSPTKSSYLSHLKFCLHNLLAN